MDTLAPVVLATDLKMDWQPLLAATGLLAETFKRRVIPLHVVEVDTHSMLIDYYRRQLAQQLFEPLLAEAKSADWEMSHPVVVTGPICDRIVEFAAEQQAALIVMGAGRIGEHGALIPGVYTEGVMQRASQGVLAVHPKSPLKFSRILCPVDNSLTAKQGLQTAITLARRFSANLTLLSVVPHVSWLEAAAEARTFTNAYEEYAVQWQREFEGAMETFDFTGVTWNPVIKFGRPAQEIVQAAESDGSDLIVMGAVGRSGLSQYLMGSTLRRVFQQLPCSLLVVHDQDRPLELGQT
jgi:nucleotide-binding universal stress UspA family protein